MSNCMGLKVQFDTMVNCMGYGRLCKMLGISSYYVEVDFFDEAFDKQQQYFDVNMEMGKARQDVEERKFEPADIESKAEDRRW